MIGFPIPEVPMFSPASPLAAMAPAITTAEEFAQYASALQNLRSTIVAGPNSQMPAMIAVLFEIDSVLGRISTMTPAEMANLGIITEMSERAMAAIERGNHAALGLIA